MDTIYGYRIIEEIGENPQRKVYKGIRLSDGKAVVIKTSDNPESSRNTFRQEYETTLLLDMEGIVRIYGIEEYPGGIALVMEDFGGVSLNKIIISQSADLKTMIRIAVKVVGILGQLHGRNLIHGDIKPSNIIVCPADSEVKISDFCHARLDSEREYAGLSFLPGTLAYMSPEQTGRMNRSIDCRSDYYSLGMTLYKMFSGSLPFNASDSIEMIYCQIAKSPMPLDAVNPQIPPPLSGIVMKLIRKNPEDRYQSVTGIRHDLERCLAELEGKGRIDPFPIGEKDVSECLNIPRKVYGREREKAALFEAYERITEGSSKCILIHGPAGSGKTSLIQDVFRTVGHQGALFIEGKFDRQKRQIPYTAVIQAFRGLIRQLLMADRETLAEWKTRFQEALGANGRIILDVIPEVEFIVGPQPPIPLLGPGEIRHVFDMVFQSFFRVVSRDAHPLILFLDDLQNADPASLKLMETILTDTGSRCFLLVGAYRSDEIGEDHPLARTLDSLAKAGVFMSSHPLASLGIAEIEAMTADMFSASQEMRPLSLLLQRKTGGNAFFIHEFINKIYREKLLRFNREKGGWEYDPDRIERLDVTENVVELLIERLNHQPEAVREVLNIASCIGNTFPASLPAHVRNVPLGETVHILIDAVREGFLIHVRELCDDPEKGKEQFVFRFLHDRIQDVCLALREAGDIRHIHLAIGRALLSDIEKKEENLFDVLFHFGEGAGLISDPDEKMQIARLALRAGRKAGNSAAYEQACGFLATGLGLLSPDSWRDHYRLTFDLHRAISEYLFLAGRMEESERMFGILMARAQTDTDRGEICASRVALYSNAGKIGKAQDMGIEALNLLGMAIDIRPERLPAQIAEELEAVQKNLDGREIGDLLHLPPIEDPLVIVTMKILMELTVPTYFANLALFPLVILKMLNLSLLHGNSQESPFAYGAYSLLLCQQLMQYRQGFEFGLMSLKLQEKMGIRSMDCKIYMIFSIFINHWKHHAETSLPILEKSYLCGRESGDLNFSSFSSGVSIINQIIIGQRSLDELVDACDGNIAFLHSIRNVAWYARQRMTRQILFALQGKTREKGSFSSDDYDEFDEIRKMEAMRYMSGIAYYYLCKARHLFLLEKYDEALAASLESEKLRAHHSCTLIYTEHYLYQSLILPALYPDAPEDAKKEFMEILRRNLSLFEKWKEVAPENFESRCFLISAEMKRIQGFQREAMDLYDAAISSAEKNRYPVMAALGNECAARFYLNCGREKVAFVYFREAVEGYREWGAFEKVRDMEERYAKILNRAHGRRREKAGRRTSVTDSSPTSGSITELVDLSSIVKASRIISGEILLNSLADRLMQILIENAGAQKGLLLIDNQENILVEALDTPSGITVMIHRPEHHGSGGYPGSVINYVKRTEEVVVLNEAVREGLFVNDPYIVETRPMSILCMPMIEQKKMAGILYLENRLVKNAFTQERVEFLKLLSAQAAISVRNALNYEEISRTKKELQESKEQVEAHLNEYKNLFNNIQDVFCRADMEGRLLLISPSVENVLGYLPEEMIGMNLADLYLDPARHQALLDALEKEGVVENFEAQIRKKDGTCIWASSSSHYFRDKNGAILGVEGISRDINARKLAEEKNRQLQIRLMQSEKMEAIGTLAGGIAHDFNNILSAIIGYSEIALEDQSDEERRKSIQEVLNAADRAANLVKQILTFSRLKEPERKPVDMRNVTMEALRFLRASLPTTVEINQHITPNSCIVVMDSTQIHQVIINLCTNAAHAMKKTGGRLTVELDKTIITEEKGVQIADLKPGTYVVLKVSDTGCGIDPAHIKRIFDPFFTTKAPGEGTGLGLSVVYGIIRNHDGAITVQSEIGKGTVFFVYLPEKSGSKPAAQGAAAPKAAVGKERILFVDDEPTLADLGVLLLKSLGYDASGLANSIEALELFKSEPHRFDLVITDMTMPRMTGVDLAREIFKIRPSMPVIICSGISEPSMIEQIEALGICAFVMKPVTKKDLSKAIRDVLDKREKAAATPKEKA